MTHGLASLMHGYQGQGIRGTTYQSPSETEDADYCRDNDLLPGTVLRAQNGNTLVITALGAYRVLAVDDDHDERVITLSRQLWEVVRPHDPREDRP